MITVEVDGNAITLNGNGKLQMPAPEGELMMPKAESSSGDISVSGNIVSPDTGRSPSLTELLTGIISRNHSAMISLAYDMSADFSTYRDVLRQIDDAYLAVRNSYALEHFGRLFNDLDDGQMKSVRHEIPMRVSEAYTEAE